MPQASKIWSLSKMTPVRHVYSSRKSELSTNAMPRLRNPSPTSKVTDAFNQGHTNKSLTWGGGWFCVTHRWEGVTEGDVPPSWKILYIWTGQQKVREHGSGALRKWQTNLRKWCLWGKKKKKEENTERKKKEERKNGKSKKRKGKGRGREKGKEEEGTVFWKMLD